MGQSIKEGQMSRWKQYQIRKQQKRKLKKKSYKVEARIAELLSVGEVDRALELAQEFLVKHPTNVRAWGYRRGVEIWKEHIEPKLAKLPQDKATVARADALKILRGLWKVDHRLTPEKVLPRVEPVIPVAD